MSTKHSTNQHLNVEQIKLKEVLREHFARHKAGGKSTRAIVFTQFRDSVEVSKRLTDRPSARPLNREQRKGLGQQGV